MGSDEETVKNTSTPQAKERSVSTQRSRATNDAFNDTRKLDQIGTLYPLDTFTVNLKSDSGRRFLKVTMSLELDTPELSHELDAKAAVLRDRIIRILSSKTLEEISSKKGNKKLPNKLWIR